MKHFVSQIGPNAAELTAYIHDDSSELGNAGIRPAILVLPGGGYSMCSDREAEPIALAFLSEGYNAFVLRYSVGVDASFEMALADAEHAVEAIRVNATAWRVDPGKVAAIGFSAGGHLAAAVGTMGRVRPDAILLGYAVTLETQLSNAKPFPGLDTHVDAMTPPAFIFATRKDPLVLPKNSLAFASALDQAGIDYEIHIFQDGTHGLALSRPLTANGARSNVDPRFAQWLPLALSWLQTRFGDFPVGDAYLERLAELNQHLALRHKPVGLLQKDPVVWDLIIQEIPALKTMAAHYEAVSHLSLAKLAEVAGDLVTEDLMRKIELAAQ